MISDVSDARSDASGRIDRQVAFVVLSSLVLFTVFWYFGRRATYLNHLQGILPDTELTPLYPFFYFVACSVVARLLVPLVLLRLVLRKRPRDFGYGFRDVRGGVWIYSVLFLAVIPFVMLASTTAPFQSYYPQFKEMIVQGEVRWEHVLCFEAVYFFLFLSGESFWRGYIIFGLRERLGYHGILVMVVPYVMSHYEKPFLETMGAIVTGCVLGFLALTHRNFWLGVLVHWGVAMTMDFMALHQLGIAIV